MKKKEPKKQRSEMSKVKRNFSAIVIETNPLSISNNSVAAAKDFFPVLKTLVVPIFPEPISLISLPKNIFLSE